MQEVRCCLGSHVAGPSLFQKACSQFLVFCPKNCPENCRGSISMRGPTARCHRPALFGRQEADPSGGLNASMSQGHVLKRCGHWGLGMGCGMQILDGEQAAFSATAFSSYHTWGQTHGSPFFHVLSSSHVKVSFLLAGDVSRGI